MIDKKLSEEEHKQQIAAVTEILNICYPYVTPETAHIALGAAASATAIIAGLILADSDEDVAMGILSSLTEDLRRSSILHKKKWEKDKD